MSFDDALKRVFDAAIQEITVLTGEERNRARQEGTDDGRAQGWEDGREQGRYEGREEATKESLTALDAAVASVRAESIVNAAANTRLLAAIRTIDEARTLAAILDALARAAAAEAGRAGVLIVQNDRIKGWRFHGFGSTLADPASVDVAVDDAGALGDVARAGTFLTDGTNGSAPPAFADLAAGRGSFAAPLMLFGETVALLYADQGNAEGAAAAGAWRETLELLARHASRALEALTAVKAARAVAGVDHPVGGHHVNASDEIDDADSSARRYAKLLVSEIKLYHEPDVVAGRRERDLATRLGGEISRARVLYDQRVPAAVRDRADYFRDELVRTLANGDATLLRLT
jgi:hypothetical protein